MSGGTATDEPVFTWLDHRVALAEDERDLVREAFRKHRINTIDVLIDLSDREMLRELDIKALGTRKTLRLELRKLRTSMALPPDPRRGFCFGWFSRPIIVARIAAAPRSSPPRQRTTVTPQSQMGSGPGERGGGKDDDDDDDDDGGGDDDHGKRRDNGDSGTHNNPGIGPPSGAPSGVRPIKRKSSLLREKSRVARSIVASSEQSVMRRKSTIQVMEEKSKRRLKDRIRKRKSNAALGLKDWVQAYDPIHDTHYFYNKQTMESAWDHPGGDQFAERAARERVTREEDDLMKLWRTKVSKKVPSKKLKGLISKIDKNNEGGLNLKRFSSLMTKLNKKVVNKELSAKVNTKHMLSRYFTNIAQHEDGLQSWMITAEQFEGWLRPPAGPENAEESVV
jgi:hypothetical protein